ncbi:MULTISPECIES: hypothetical protein [Brevibacillus]|uniref:hypothetical protein n=1 Tax=Brevibacillus TaxID=55080 RepID=UPI000D0F0E41|nr:MULTISPECIES: hypothetical protein [Brevibacillus]PSJ67537.1 hypothetical protein C7J99_19805 [Brevibacillus brevis]RED32786.1 hypothetical protein DES34_10398 [Brevibacillus brevis]TQK73710.1 hypothetical protein FB479_102344 [Brevibacillus sp. AG162]VEF90459.1 Uncharacterised protein [Brevibacillus brevis]GEC92808.1 hypothetical protein BBR01nite_51390 [Brevibacillus brevis]
MIQVGDLVVYVKDGAKGVVIHIEEDRFQIKWEDDFVSWEKKEWLLTSPLENGDLQKLKEQRE